MVGASHDHDDARSQGTGARNPSRSVSGCRIGRRGVPERIAKLLGLDEDELLALVGKVSSDLTEIIRKHPREIASFLRSMKGMSPKQVSQRLGSPKPKKESS
jgi:hypothetical protein